MSEIAIDDLARQVGRSVSTLRRWEREGRIPVAHRVGLRGTRHWTDEEAAQVRAMLGVEPPPTLEDRLLHDLSEVLAKVDIEQSSNPLDDLLALCQRLALIIGRAAEQISSGQVTMRELTRS